MTEGERLVVTWDHSTGVAFCQRSDVERVVLEVLDRVLDNAESYTVLKGKARDAVDAIGFGVAHTKEPETGVQDPMDTAGLYTVPGTPSCLHGFLRPDGSGGWRCGTCGAERAGPGGMPGLTPEQIEKAGQEQAEREAETGESEPTALQQYFGHLNGGLWAEYLREQADPPKTTPRTEAQQLTDLRARYDTLVEAARQAVKTREAANNSSAPVPEGLAETFRFCINQSMERLRVLLPEGE
jgi:ribosomal protein L37AE/L43A